MAHGFQLAILVFMCSLGVIGLTMPSGAAEINQQFGVNETIDFGQSQRLYIEGNPRITKLSAMRPGRAKIMKNELNSRHFETPELIFIMQ
jgi:hypothetical protein